MDVKSLLQHPESVKGLRASVSCGGRAGDGAGRDAPWGRGDTCWHVRFFALAAKMRREGENKTWALGRALWVHQNALFNPSQSIFVPVILAIKKQGEISIPSPFIAWRKTTVF